MGSTTIAKAISTTTETTTKITTASKVKITTHFLTVKVGFLD